MSWSSRLVLRSAEQAGQRSWLRALRVNLEQEPVIVFCCALSAVGACAFINGGEREGLRRASPLPPRAAGILLPVFLGDGGRSVEEKSTSYSYRIRYLYPPQKSDAGGSAEPAES